MKASRIKSLCCSILIVLSGCASPGPVRTESPLAGLTPTPSSPPATIPEGTVEPIETSASISGGTDQPLHQETYQQKIDQLDNHVVEMGYLSDYSITSQFVTKLVEINGESIEAIGFRIGLTEIWVEKSFVDKSVRYYSVPGQPEIFREAGLTVVPNKNISDWKYKSSLPGALIHTYNTGFDKDVSAFLDFVLDNTTAGNPAANKYVIIESAHPPGRTNATILRELPAVDASLPVRFILLDPKLTREKAQKQKIYGGQPNTPYRLNYYASGEGYTSLIVDNNGGLTIAFSQLLTEDGYISRDVNSDASFTMSLLTTQGTFLPYRNPNIAYGLGITQPYQYIYDTFVPLNSSKSDYNPVFVWGK